MLLTYTCGLWLLDSQASVWENFDNKPACRLLGIPTWARSSLGHTNGITHDESQKGVAVHWRDEQDTVGCETLYVIEQSAALHVDTTAWLSHFSWELLAQPDLLYGNDSRFAVLNLRGRLLQMSVGTYLNLDERRIWARNDNRYWS